ncbi:WSC-domain-containing protein [Stipitochalara longipes BDJ]|nr:WSC-domain-containing protein [Stipitochalara longipes BDJ]
MASLPGYAHVGCFPDSDARLLDGALYTDSNGLTRESCIQYCSYQIGSGRFYTYIGVEDSDQCFCGTDPTRTPDPKERNDSSCNMECPGNSSELCGGNGYIDIYSATVTPSGKTLLPTSTALGTTATTVSLSTVTVTAHPTSTTSNALAPADQTATVIALSVITSLLALSLLGILGLWCLRKRGRREAIPQVEPAGFHDQYELKHPIEVPSNAPPSELVDTGVPHYS